MLPMNERNVNQINWDLFEPVDRAVLCFIRKDRSLLLIHKKRGLGKGKINAPGGRIEAGETIYEAAIRETIEEVGVTPSGLRHAGELTFAFVDGYSLHCSVLVASGGDGEPTETDEADPFWCAESEIPFDRMWTDDRLWIPLMLEGSFFVGKFIFDGDTMLSYRLS